MVVEVEVLVMVVMVMMVRGNGRGRRGERASQIHTHNLPSLALEMVMIQGMENYMLIES